MKKYIPLDALVAETNRLDEFYHLSECDGGQVFIESLLSFLDTIEVKEVDFEKEVIDWWNAHYSSKAYTFEGYSGHYVENSTLIEFAKYFFELGLKAQKGE